MSSEDSFHCTSQVVIAKLFEYPAKVSDRPLVLFQKGLPAGMWESTMEGSSTGHAPHAKHVEVLSFAGNARIGFKPVHLGFFSPTIRLRNEQFLAHKSQRHLSLAHAATNGAFGHFHLFVVPL